MKKIAIFNNKGGVSKTTSTFHLGWTLANLGHKVLMVDGDPQCNLTELFLGDSFEEYYQNQATQKHNIKDGCAAPFLGLNTPIASINCPQSLRQPNLYLLPGSLSLAEFENQLNMAMTVPNALPAMSGLPGSINALINQVVDRYQIDYVLIDLNPGINAINKALVLSSDGFVIPANPDIFCNMAIKVLKTILPQWTNWKKINQNVFNQSSYPLPANTPKFLGTIVQRFNIRNGDPVSAHQENINEIEATITSELIPALQDEDMLFSQNEYQQVGLMPNYTLGQIKEFNTLGAKSHQFHVPVFELNDQELNARGKVMTQFLENQDEFKRRYTDISTKIIALLQ